MRAIADMPVNKPYDQRVASMNITCNPWVQLVEDLDLTVATPRHGRGSQPTLTKHSKHEGNGEFAGGSASEKVVRQSCS